MSDDAPKFAPKIPAKKKKKKAKKTTKAAGVPIIATPPKPAKKTPRSSRSKPERSGHDKYTQQTGGVFAQGFKGMAAVGRTPRPRPGRVVDTSTSSATTTGVSLSSSSSSSMSKSATSAKAGARASKGTKGAVNNIAETLGMSKDVEAERRPFDGDWLASTDSRFKPVLLPIESLRIESDDAVMSSGGRKDEEDDTPVQTENMQDVIASHGSAFSHPEKELQQLLQEESGEMFLIQFPRLLPLSRNNQDEPNHRVGEDDDADGAMKQEEDDEAALNSPPEDPQVIAQRAREPSDFAQLPEGTLGKLRVHRSGKVSVVMGDQLFEMVPGTRPNFAQEVATIKKGSVTCLGPVTHRCAIIPDLFAS